MTEWNDRFLEELDPVPWQVPTGGPASIVSSELFVGRGEYGLQVALASSQRHPNNDDVRRLWQARQRGGVSPLLLVVAFPEGTATKVKLCGPAGEHPVIVTTTVSQAERLSRAALTEPSRHAAIRFLVAMLPEIDSDLPGVRNTGLVATHELRSGVPARSDWAQATLAGKGLLTKGGRELVEGLGFKVEQLGTTASVLAGTDGKRAVAVFLDEGETFDDPGARFQGTSPISHALALAERENLPWVILTRHRQVRLYAARPDTGVGRKGRADTYLELNLALLPEDRAGYLPLLFGATALAEQGTIEEILRSSERFAADLASRLRERVYNECVPRLAEAIGRRLELDSDPTDDDLQHAYEQTLTVLFRLLFVAYAEDKDLLPYRTNSKYADHSLKLISRRLAEDVAGNFDGWDDQSIELWEDVKQLWRAVDRGNRSWGVPAYNGGLFSDATDVNPAGAALADIELADAELAPALAALLVDTNPSDGVTGPIDFRSLSVREFGTIYEGLLESMLSVASVNLTLNDRGSFVPAAAGQPALVKAGAIYFHNRSGARKSTGSYFTKPFAVEHLLDHALEPALAVHVERLMTLVEAGDDAAAAEAFFDFRCVDLAMGSGHFLTAAVDRIEARLSSFLALNPVPPVLAELDQLRMAAVEALGDLSDGVELETTSLLRRQVARRCVYGVDLNPISVELARLAVWIHTFVPGLPLSFLDHNLVTGNSLTGIGTLDEVVTFVEGPEHLGMPSLLRPLVDEFLERASSSLHRLAAVADATLADVKLAREEHNRALKAVEPAARLFDLVIAARLGELQMPASISETSIASAWQSSGAGVFAASLNAVHLPIAFPEVFVRADPGFDCVLGNPPWDKLKHEPQQFWLARSPGLNALPDSRRDSAIEELRRQLPLDAQAEEAEAEWRAILQRVAQVGYRLTGGGHHDFAKLFCERAINLLSSTGTLGYVLPRPSLVLAGWGKLRGALFAGRSVETAQARNRSGWLFDDVDERTTVVLLSRLGPSDNGAVRIWPDVSSPAEMKSLDGSRGVVLDETELASLSETFVVPWFSFSRDVTVFDKLRGRPSLSSGKGWVTGHHDARWDFRSSGPHARYSHSNERTGDWAILMTRHVTAFGLDHSAAFQKYVTPDELPIGRSGLAHTGAGAQFGPGHPWLIVRHPSRNDDSRTMIASALPSHGFIFNKGYVHSVSIDPGSAPRAGLALLGYINTVVCDWWARRFVDRHVTAPVVNNLVLPDWSDDDTALAAECAATLLSANGLSDIAVIGDIAAFDRGAARSQVEARVCLEVLATKGFGIELGELPGIFEDFRSTEPSCPPWLRAQILDGLR